ncbi:MAG: dockerin type I repeat-containing protein [Spirochaetales bacterium]|nr:dockerin type I repeat-containing protein [Spirochaetales bacterium]
MKKNLYYVSVLCLLLTLSLFGYSQISEKTIGPVTISQSIIDFTFPVDSVTITLSAPPSDETHRVYFELGGNDWVDADRLLYVDGGEVLEVDIAIQWPYIAPGETKQMYIIVKVQPDGRSQEEITDEQGISVSGEKPAYPDQDKLSLIRDGYPLIIVAVTPLSPAGQRIDSQGTTDLYFDRGTIVELNAARPVPTPCGTGCAQVTFGGMSGDVVITGTFTYEVTMDADKEITINYYLSEAAPTIAPTPNPIRDLGDVNADNTIDIIDALLVAQHYVGLNPDNFNSSAADSNCDVNIDIIDALLIAQYYVGLITEFC